MRNPLDKRWVNAFMGMARSVATLSYSQLQKVGAVVVNGDTFEIESFGFNGTPTGHPHLMEKLIDGKLVPIDEAITATENCLMRLNGIRPPWGFGSLMYITHCPNKHDALLIANTHIQYVIIDDLDADPDGLVALDDMNITVFSTKDLQKSSDEDEIIAHVQENMAQAIEAQDEKTNTQSA